MYIISDKIKRHFAYFLPHTENNNKLHQSIHEKFIPNDLPPCFGTKKNRLASCDIPRNS